MLKFLIKHFIEELNKFYILDPSNNKNIFTYNELYKKISSQYTTFNKNITLNKDSIVQDISFNRLTLKNDISNFLGENILAKYKINAILIEQQSLNKSIKFVEYDSLNKPLKKVKI